MRLLGKLEKSKDFWVLLSTTIFFFLLRFPSFFEPYWYGDEGIYQVLGLGMNNGKLLYRDIFDNKPPLLYSIYALFNSDQFFVRLASAVFGIISIFLFFKLCQKILKQKNAIYLATFLFALLFGLPLIEGNIANAENFMLLFNIAAGLLVVKSLDISNQGTKTKLLFIAGVIASFSFLLKIVGLFDFAAFLVFLFFANFSQKFTNIIKVENIKKELFNLFPFIFGFIIIPLVVTIFFFLNGSFSYFLKATFSNNIGYVGYGNNFIIPQGLLILKLIILFSLLGFIFIRKKALGLETVFIYLWLFFSFFNAFFSQRPYTHYVLVVLPSLCLLVGLVLLKNRYLKFSALLLIVAIILLATNFTYFLRTAFYYQNFISFITNNKSLDAYQRFFDGNTPNDYELAAFINMKAKTNDNIFIWGNNAQVYKMSNKLPPGRYAVAYHITNYKDGIENTLEGLQKSKPKFIVLMPNVSPYPFSLVNYIQAIKFNNVNIYERIN